MQGVRDLFDSRKVGQTRMDDQTVNGITAESEEIGLERERLKQQEREYKDALGLMTEIEGRLEISRVSLRAAFTSVYGEIR